MKDTPQKGIRKTIYIDEKLFQRAETMYKHGGREFVFRIRCQGD